MQNTQYKMINQKYGLLKVVSLNKKINKQYYWDCSCDCGGTCIVTSSNLKKKYGTKSCGCLKLSLIQGDKIKCRLCNIIKHKDEFYFSNKASKRTSRHTICKKCMAPISAKKRQTTDYEYRMQVIKHYSNGTMQCECCKESLEEFLTIDHINGGGNKHRKNCNIKGSGALAKWLVKNNFPSGFRILCMNCNTSYGRLGYCPHKCSDRHPQGRVRY